MFFRVSDNHKIEFRTLNFECRMTKQNAAVGYWVDQFKHLLILNFLTLSARRKDTRRIPEGCISPAFFRTYFLREHGVKKDIERPKNIQHPTRNNEFETTLDRYRHFLRTITAPIGMLIKLLAAFCFGIRHSAFDIRDTNRLAFLRPLNSRIFLIGTSLLTQGCHGYIVD